MPARIIGNIEYEHSDLKYIFYLYVAGLKNIVKPCMNKRDYKWLLNLLAHDTTVDSYTIILINIHGESSLGDIIVYRCYRLIWMRKFYFPTTIKIHVA